MMNRRFVILLALSGCLAGEETASDVFAKKDPKLDKCAKKPTKKKCATTTATITPDGGTITTADGLVLQVPYGAVDQPVTLSVTATTLDPDPALGGQGLVYAFEPEGTVFVRPVSVSLPLPPGMTTASVYWTKL